MPSPTSTRHLGRLPLARVLLVTMAMLAVACGADDDVSTRAQAIIDGATPEGQSEVVETSECTTETIIDEYGFEIEITECDQPTENTASPTITELPPQTLPLNALESIATLAPTESTQAATRRLIESLDATYTMCADLGAWAAALDAVIPTLVALTDLIRDADSNEWVGSDQAEQLVAAVHEHLFIQSECPAAEIEVEPEEDTEEDTEVEVDPDEEAEVDPEEEANDALARGLEASGRASGEFDRLRVAALGLTSLETASDFWVHSDQLGHIAAISSTAVFSVSFDLGIVGGDVARRGIDPDTLTDALNQRAFNASLVGMRPTYLAGWLDDLASIGFAPTTLILADSSSAFFEPCNEDTAGAFEDTALLRSEAFRNVPGLNVFGGALRLSGGFTRSNTGPLSNRYVASYGDSLTGRSKEIPRVQPDLRAEQLERYEGLYATPTICEASFDELERQASTAVDAGVTVVIVSMPLSDQVADLHPDGRAGHAAVVERQQQTAAASGASFADLSSLLTVDQFFDVRNPTEAGRQLITAELVEALS